MANNSIILPIFSTIFTIDFSELDLRSNQNNKILHLVPMTPETYLSEKKLKLKLQKNLKLGETLFKRESEFLKNKDVVMINKRDVCENMKIRCTYQSISFLNRHI